MKIPRVYCNVCQHQGDSDWCDDCEDTGGRTTDYDSEGKRVTICTPKTNIGTCFKFDPEKHKEGF